MTQDFDEHCKCSSLVDVLARCRHARKLGGNNTVETEGSNIRFAHAFCDNLAGGVHDRGQAPERPSPASVGALLRQPLCLRPRLPTVDGHVHPFDLAAAPAQSVPFYGNLGEWQVRSI